MDFGEGLEVGLAEVSLVIGFADVGFAGVGLGGDFVVVCVEEPGREGGAEREEERRGGADGGGIFLGSSEGL